jgi:hypothetical protein
VSGATRRPVSAERDQTPTLLGSVDMPAYGPDPVQWYGRNATIRGRLAYIAGLGGSLIIADFSNPAAPRVLSNTPVGAPFANAQVYRALIHGRYCYCACEANKTVDVVDVTNPHAPVIAGQITTGRWPKWLYARGRYLFVGEADSGVGQVQVFDINNPVSGLAVGTIPVGDHPYGMWGQGRYLYVVSYMDDSFRVIDLDNLTQVANVTTGLNTNPYVLAVQGARAYVVHQTPGGAGQGLQAWDISDPTAPTLIAHAAVAEQERAIAVAGDNLYTLDNGEFRLRVYDVTDATAMVLRYDIATPGGGSWIEVTGNLGLINFADPAGLAVGTLQVWDLGGATDRALEAGSAEIGALGVRTNVEVGNDLGVGGGLDVGGGAHIDGVSSVERADGSNGSSAFQVTQRATDATATTSTLSALGGTILDSSTIAGSKARAALSLTWQKTGAGAQTGTQQTASVTSIISAGSVTTARALTTGFVISAGASIVTELTQLHAPGPSNSGALAARYGVLVENVTGAGTFTGAHRGIYVKQLSGGAANSIHAIYVEGTTPCYFGGLVQIVGDLDHDGTKVGFYGTAPVTKPTITGSRGGNAGLASLLTQLASLGLIVDGTTA